MQKSAAFAVAAITLAACVTPALAQVAPALSLDPFPKGQFYQSNDQFVFTLKRPLADQPDTQTEIFFWDSHGRIRFSRVKQDETLLDAMDQPALGYRVLDLELNPTTDRLPSALNTIALAGAIPFKQIGPGHLTLIVGAGYAGNSPFNDKNAYYGIGHLQYGIPLSDDNHALVLSVDYDGHNAFMPDVPLPGVGLAGRDDDAALGHVDYLAGFPYSRLTWTPPAFDRRLTVDLHYSFPESADATISAKLADGLSLYASYFNFFEGFRIHATPDSSDDRMFFQMRRAEIGVRLVSGKLIDLAGGIGYAFNQQLTTGFDARNQSPFATLRDTPYLSVTLRGGF